MTVNHSDYSPLSFLRNHLWLTFNTLGILIMITVLLSAIYGGQYILNNLYGFNISNTLANFAAYIICFDLSF